MGTDIKPGDTVRLKSGGPLMTVSEVGETHMTGVMSVWCNWFVGNKAYDGVFPINTVEKAEKPSATFSAKLSRS